MSLPPLSLEFARSISPAHMGTTRAVSASRVHVGMHVPRLRMHAVWLRPSYPWLCAWNMKHLMQHTSKIAETFGTYTCHICVKHMNIQIKHLQHESETDETFFNRRLQHMYIAIATYATSGSTFATSIWNTCNIPLKHLKKLKCMFATCAFSATSPWWGHVLRWPRPSCRGLR
jgi:hypothetical protein